MSRVAPPTEFGLLPTLRELLLAVASIAVASLPLQSSAASLWAGVHGPSGARIVRIDTTSNTFTTLLDDLTLVEDLAVDIAGNYYAIVDNTANNQLVRNGAVLPIDPSVCGAPEALDYDAGRLFVACSSPPQIIQVDTASGSSTPVLSSPVFADLQGHMALGFGGAFYTVIDGPPDVILENLTPLDPPSRISPNLDAESVSRGPARTILAAFADASEPDPDDPEQEPSVTLTRYNTATRIFDSIQTFSGFTDVTDVASDEFGNVFVGVWNFLTGRGAILKNGSPITAPAGLDFDDSDLVIAVPQSPGCAPITTAILEEITIYEVCNDDSPVLLSPRWGSFGSALDGSGPQVLLADSGERLSLLCGQPSPRDLPNYQLLYGRPGGVLRRAGTCPFSAGCNRAWFLHAGDDDNNGKPDCFIRIVWVSADYGLNDNPNPFTMLSEAEPTLDWAVTVYDAAVDNLEKYNMAFTYPEEFRNPPPPAIGRNEGAIAAFCTSSNPTLIRGDFLELTELEDPPLGDETEAFFDKVQERLNALPPPFFSMVGNPFSLCDFDGNGRCGAADVAFFRSLEGTCRGDQRYDPVADPNQDGCVTPSDEGLLFPVDSVRIQIKTDSAPSPINPRSRGVIPVAILGSETLDVSDVDAATLAFGPAGAAVAHRNGPHLKDVNGDGLADLLAHFRTQESGIAAGDTEACVTGELLDGTPFEGCDSVKTVPPR